MKAHHRPAFTITQLLVIVVLLAILAGLLLPFVFQVRVSSGRVQSQNNLRQIALALHNYNDTNGKLPPGNDNNNFSTAAYLLPYIEQNAVYNQIDFKKPADDKANAGARKAVIKVYLSPLDPQPAVRGDWGATNYLFNAGTKAALAENDGVFFQDSKSKIPQTFLDGTSNTIVAGETLKGQAAKKPPDVRRQHVALKKDALKDLKESAGVDDFKAGKNLAADRCASWMDGRFLQGTFNAGRVPNDLRPDVNCQGLGGWSALRSLDDEINVAMGDGSVRSINARTIKAETWKALLTPAGGEELGNDF